MSVIEIIWAEDELTSLCALIDFNIKVFLRSIFGRMKKTRRLRTMDFGKDPPFRLMVTVVGVILHVGFSTNNILQC